MFAENKHRKSQGRSIVYLRRLFQSLAAHVIKESLLRSNDFDGFTLP